MPDEEQPKMHPSFVNVIRQKERVRAKLANIKHKIGIYSAKGGVGKTTIAVNMAYTLKMMGYKVGLLDADIDCPNLGLFLGISEMMDTSSMPLKPLEKDGVKVASTAMLVNQETKPIIWRGPLVAKMIGDFLENTDWGELDYLVVDMPPGTSDSPLSIMQLLQLDGFIIVTTPQRIAAVNSIRSGLMAKRLNVPVLGVIENMSDGDVSQNAKDVAQALGTDILGSVELNGTFNKLSDSGKVPVLEDKRICAIFEGMAERLTGES